MFVWRSRFSRFCEDTYGGITALTVTVFLVMMVSVGMAVDFMRHETYRAELQDALDRGVLAAAAFSQTVDAEATVRAYLKSTNYVKHCYQLETPVTPVQTTGTRTITAKATCKLDTFFLRIVGIPNLDVNAVGTAIEGASKVEIALVLDISTSMVINESGTDGDTRLEVLQSSANQFMDLLFSPVNNDRLSLSLVPFAGHVNPGSTAFNYFNDTSVHDYSHCIEFEAADMNFFANGADDKTAHPSNTMTQAPPENSRSQMQHFNYSKYWDGDTSTYSHGPLKNNGNGQLKKLDVGWGWCPDDAQQIHYFETNKEILKARINALRTHEATGSYYGARWGAMLLDPSTNGLTSALVDADVVSSSEGDLPRAYDDKEVQKFLIMMGDGATTSQSRLVSHQYDETSDYDHWATNLSNDQYNDFIDVDVTGAQIYDGPTVDGGWTSYSDEASREDARIAFRNVCETAKDNGVIIFTIGFDLIPDPSTATQTELDEAVRAEEDLEACASENKFFNVRGQELAGAFSEIASTIQKLRLVN